MELRAGATTLSVSPMRRFKQIFNAFRYRNFRLFFAGQGISLIGFWMHLVAMQWLVYRLTDSQFKLGLIGFLSNLPILVLAPFGGILADRLDRRKFVLVTQVIAVVPAFLFAYLTYAGLIQFEHIVILSLALGLLTAFYMPVRQAFVADLVDNKSDLPNAVALSSLLFNGARMVGPALAGVTIALFGEGMCFLINALSYVAIIFALLAMRMPPRERKTPTKHGLHELKEAAEYAFHSRPIRSILLLFVVISLFGMAYSVLMPVFARDILGGGPRTLGNLMTLSGVGALIATVTLTIRKKVRHRVKLISLSVAIVGAGMIAFALSQTLWLSMILVFFIGFAMMIQMVICNSALQTIVHEEKRGRVMSFFTMSFMGMMPFGSILAGALGHQIGAPMTLVLCGCACVVGGGLFYKRLKS